MLRAAAEQFGGKDESEIAQVAKETLEGHQRAIMGTMSVEEIYRDRKKFSSGVFKVASNDLINMGIMVISYTIKEITDDVGYLKGLFTNYVDRYLDFFDPPPPLVDSFT